MKRPLIQLTVAIAVLLNNALVLADGWVLCIEGDGALAIEVAGQDCCLPESEGAEIRPVDCDCIDVALEGSRLLAPTQERSVSVPAPVCEPALAAWTPLATLPRRTVERRLSDESDVVARCLEPTILLV